MTEWIWVEMTPFSVTVGFIRPPVPGVNKIGCVTKANACQSVPLRPDWHHLSEIQPIIGVSSNNSTFS